MNLCAEDKTRIIAFIEEQADILPPYRGCLCGACGFEPDLEAEPNIEVDNEFSICAECLSKALAVEAETITRRAPEPMTVRVTFNESTGERTYYADSFPERIRLSEGIALGVANLDVRLVGVSVMQGQRYVRFALNNGIALYRLVEREWSGDYLAERVSWEMPADHGVGVIPWV